MKASVYEEYGGLDVLQTAEVDRPEPGRREVLVRVHAAALNPKDLLLRKGKFGLLGGRAFPKTPGYDVAGIVEALGPGARGVQAGQQVYGMINAMNPGGCAEFVTVPQGELAPKPESLSMTEAAALPLVGQTALQALRLMGLQRGHRILINGASGGVGLHAVQIAKRLGGLVTAVCSHRNVERVLEVGADEVVDYTKEDPLGLSVFDGFFDAFGNLPYEKSRKLVKRARSYVSVLPRPSTFANELLARLGLPRPRLVIVRSRRQDLEQLSEWVAEGTLRPIVDRVYPLEEMVDAQAYLETKRARGKVVIRVAAGMN
ncbi:MAG: NAD(P)-dependent alcohol dehydrogenase [Acidobacteriota bacterium]